MSYPEFINLPFNFSSIKDDFKLRHQSPEQQTDDYGTWAIMQGNNILVVPGDNAVQTGFCLYEGNKPRWVNGKRTPVLVGEWKGKPFWAVTIPSDQTAEAPFVAEPFNSGSNLLDIRTLTLAGIAKQVLHWLSRSRHCARCGCGTIAINGTWGRKCPACRADHFPHIHPCAIVLVKRGDELLLTRKAEWVPGRYSLVAGFVDFGESLEECAIREAKEETGITIENVRYVGSQNWPFPAQLMAGFVADYAAGEIVVDHHELEDARWFHMDALPDLPLSRSISRHIIDNYGR